MKARKTMKNQALIQEVIQQISQRFTPKIPDIKKVRSLSSFSILPTTLTSSFSSLASRLSTICSRRSTSSVWKAPPIRSHT